MQAGDDWKEFATKVRWLYDAIGDTMDVSALPWITHWFTGMTPSRFTVMAHEALCIVRPAPTLALAKAQVAEPRWLQGQQAGQVSVSYKQGITVSPEIQNRSMRLSPMALMPGCVLRPRLSMLFPRPRGFGIEGVDGVLAMTNKEQNGKYVSDYDYAFHAQTQGKGKTLSISKLIAPQRQSRPVFCSLFRLAGRLQLCERIRRYSRGPWAQPRPQGRCLFWLLWPCIKTRKITVPRPCSRATPAICCRDATKNGGYLWPEVQQLARTSPSCLAARPRAG